MLTRSSAEGAAPAAAAVFASAASFASKAARGLDGRRRAGRYTRDGNGVLHRSHRIVSRVRPLLLTARKNGTSAGRARACVCFAGRHRPARLLLSKPRASSDATEAAEATTAAAAAAAPSADERVRIAKPEKPPSRPDFGTS